MEVFELQAFSISALYEHKTQANVPNLAYTIIVLSNVLYN